MQPATGCGSLTQVSTLSWLANDDLLRLRTRARRAVIWTERDNAVASGISMNIRRLFAVSLIVAVGYATPALAQDSCDAHFTRSQGMTEALTEAFTVMQTKDAAGMARSLPKLEALLNAVPATEIKPELCGNRINAYSRYHYARLSFLRANGVDTGFPKDALIVKQPDLNHSSVAYAIGWIRYEQGDFAGALAAFEKGLAIDPHNNDLQNEYIATLAQLGRYADVVSFADKTLMREFDIADQTRAKLYKARGVALFANGDLKASLDSLTVALRYQRDEETSNIEQQVKAELAAKPN